MLRKKYKKIALPIVLAVMFTSLFGNIVSAKKIEFNDFTYNTNDVNVKWKKADSFYVRTCTGEKLGTCTYVMGLARIKGTNKYNVMIKTVMTPNKNKVVINSAGQAGYGYSDYLTHDCIFPTLNAYRPVNNPKQDSVSFSIGADASGGSVSASYSIKHNDLKIIPGCDTPKRRYYVEYDYKPSVANPFADNTYVKNESIQLGMAQFTKSGSSVSFTMNYYAEFGAAGNQNISPWKIWLGYNQSKHINKTFTFSIDKK